MQSSGEPAFKRKLNGSETLPPPCSRVGCGCVPTLPASAAAHRPTRGPDADITRHPHTLRQHYASVDGCVHLYASMCFPGLYKKGDFIGRCICVYLQNAIRLADGSVAARKVGHFSTFDAETTEPAERTDPQRISRASIAEPMRSVDGRMRG